MKLDLSKKLSKLKMPASKKPAELELDLGADDEEPGMGDDEADQGGEEDASLEPMEGEVLADDEGLEDAGSTDATALSDDDLLAEIAKRGLMAKLASAGKGKAVPAPMDDEEIL